MRLTIILILVAIHFSFGQERILTQDSDTTFWYDWKSGIVEELGLTQIDQSEYDFEFRFWGGNRVIRLWKENQAMHSEVIFFIQEYDLKKESPSGRIYTSGLQLSDWTTTEIHNLMLDFEILKLPTDEQISGWQKGLDGITYIIEVAEQDKFSFKSYWTPNSYPNIKEARYINYFKNQVNAIKQINQSFDKYMAKLPFKSYYPSYEGGVIAIITN
jgi:hypothetical protein